MNRHQEGILLGVILGGLPIVLPGTPAPVRLGLAGGPLIVALVLSQIGRAGPLIWYLTPGANLVLREIGIVLFLACDGLKSGSRFLEGNQDPAQFHQPPQSLPASCGRLFS